MHTEREDGVEESGLTGILVFLGRALLSYARKYTRFCVRKQGFAPCFTYEQNGALLLVDIEGSNSYTRVDLCR